jgi:heme oxygenase
VHLRNKTNSYYFTLQSYIFTAMLSDDLKEQTQVNHQLLEKKLVLKMRSLCSQSDYVKLLSFFYSYFGGLEQQISKHLIMERIPDYMRRRKAEALLADIKTLGAEPPALADGSHLPTIVDHRQALGALYVMEGSTLGGEIISRMIGKQLSLVKGLSFFKGYGHETADMWQAFKADLNKPENLPGDAVVEAANETFRKFADWLDLSY